MPLQNSILAIRLTSLGDVLLATPAVRAIKKGMPETHITWLVEGSVAGLLAHQDFIDRVIEFPRGEIGRAAKAGRFFSAGRVLSSFRRVLRREEYDLALDFHGIMKSALLARMARARKRIGFDGTFAKEASWITYDERIAGRDRRMHKVERNMLFASHLGIDATPEIGLQTSTDSECYVDAWRENGPGDRPLIAVNPFCSRGSEFKRWDFAGYARVIEKVGNEMGATAVILWGPGEEEEARQLQQMTGDRALLAPPTTVPQLLSLVKKAVIYLGGDTGVMHLAALAGVPVVAVFGPTDHLINGPYGPNHVIVRNDQPCSPCRDKSCTRRTCIRSIDADEVYGAVREVWEKQERNGERID
jgi:heptosyltransferase I